jgi:hypothetical protein
MGVIGTKYWVVVDSPPEVVPSGTPYAVQITQTGAYSKLRNAACRIVATATWCHMVSLAVQEHSRFVHQAEDKATWCRYDKRCKKQHAYATHADAWAQNTSPGVAVELQAQCVLCQECAFVLMVEKRDMPSEMPLDTSASAVPNACVPVLLTYMPGGRGCERTFCLLFVVLCVLHIVMSCFHYDFLLASLWSMHCYSVQHGVLFVGV